MIVGHHQVLSHRFYIPQAGNAVTGSIKRVNTCRGLSILCSCFLPSDALFKEDPGVHQIRSERARRIVRSLTLQSWLIPSTWTSNFSLFQHIFYIRAASCGLILQLPKGFVKSKDLFAYQAGNLLQVRVIQKKMSRWATSLFGCFYPWKTCRLFVLVEKP